MAAIRNLPSTGIPWVDAVIGSFRSDPMGGLGPMPMGAGAGIVSPGTRMALQHLAEQGAERIPKSSLLGGAARRRIADMLGRDIQIQPLAAPATELPSPQSRMYGMALDINLPQEVANVTQVPRDLTHYLTLLNRLMKMRNPITEDLTQRGAYDLMLLEQLGGKLP